MKISKGIHRGVKDKKQLPLIAAIVSIFLVSSYVNAQEADLIGNQEGYGKGGLSRGQFKNYNLIIISLGNVGAQHMSLYGYRRKTTPRLDNWARDAIVFDSAFSCASWTLPVATSLFTSLYPYAHKIFNRDIRNLLDEDIETLPELLKENGYKTAAFTGGLDYFRGFGHMRGFDETDDNPNFTGFEVTLKQAGKWLSRGQNGKFLLFIHGYTAHSPFDPPEKFRGTFSNPQGRNITVDHKRSVRGFENSQGGTYQAYYAGAFPIFRNPDFSFEKARPVKVILTQDDINYLRDLYDEEVLYQDSLIGDFLDSLDERMLNNTIVIIFSEHGEMFAKHGRFGRAGTIRGTLYDDVIHIPLVIKISGFPGRVVKGLVQVIDIMPTILDMLGIPLPEKIQGRSLLPLINGERDVNDFVYAGSEFNVGKLTAPPFYPYRSINESVRNYSWKLIHEIVFSHPSSDIDEIKEERFELYNVLEDPAELIDLIDEYPMVAQGLRKKLIRWSGQSKRFLSAQPTTKQLPGRLLEDARRHGYW
jgi:arylsulfatase A-like enzyme